MDVLPSTPRPSPSAELLLVTPLVPSTSRPRSQKRQIAPSFEASSPKKIAIIVLPGIVNPLQSTIQRPAKLNSPRWPVAAQEATIDERQLILPNPPRAPGQSVQHLQSPLSNQTIIRRAQEVVVPFDLRDDPAALSVPENQEILMNIFPNTTGCGSDGIFLYIYVSTMPPKPWPKRIAGLALYLSPLPSPDDCPMPLGLSVQRKNGTIADYMDGYDMENWTPLFEVVRDHFIALEIPITQVIYQGNFVLVVLEFRNINIAKLPWKVAQIPCRYLYEDEMGKPRFPQARQQNDPTPGNPDQSQYTTLRPGVRVTSAYMPSQPDKFQATTAGVLVQDEIGNRFMTVTAHGFPAECGTDVNHAFPASGRRIGEIIHEISHTDIGLVKLESNENFFNTKFESTCITEPIQLKQLIPAKSLRPGDYVFLDSPDTGCIEGTFMATAFQRVPSDEPFPSPNQQWAFTVWVYMGQDSEANLPAAICGSAIWTEQGDVVGFFRYAPEQGNQGRMKDCCTSTAADELIKKGFTLVDASN